MKGFFRVFLGLCFLFFDGSFICSFNVFDVFSVFEGFLRVRVVVFSCLEGFV